MGLSRTKTAVTWLTSTSNSAGGTTTGTAVDLTGMDGALFEAGYTNATAPTIGMTFVVQVSNDNNNWDDHSTETAPTTASTSGAFQPVVVPKEVMYARAQLRGNTGQAVTGYSRGSKVAYS